MFATACRTRLAGCTGVDDFGQNATFNTVRAAVSSQTTCREDIRPGVPALNDSRIRNMLKTEFVAYLLRFMTSVVPMSEQPSETVDSVTDRYTQIAETIADVVMDPNEEPAFRGEHGREMTGVLLASIARFESNYKKGPIHGDCSDSRDGICRNDNKRPRSFCYMQIMPGPSGIVLVDQGWNYAADGDAAIHGSDLDADVDLCFRVGLHMARASLKTTGDLGVYTGEGKGGKKSEHRIKLAKWWFLKSPVTKEIRDEKGDRTHVGWIGFDDSFGHGAGLRARGLSSCF